MSAPSPLPPPLSHPWLPSLSQGSDQDLLNDGDPLSLTPVSCSNQQFESESPLSTTLPYAPVPLASTTCATVIPHAELLPLHLLHEPSLSLACFAPGWDGRGVGDPTMDDGACVTRCAANAHSTLREVRNCTELGRVSVYEHLWRGAQKRSGVHVTWTNLGAK